MTLDKLKKQIIKLLIFFIYPKVLRRQCKRYLKWIFGFNQFKPETLWEQYTYQKTQKQFWKQHQNDDIFAYRIVSLGSNCFPRTVATWWKRKPTKRQGEIGCPFDLSLQPLQLVEKYVATDFKDYFSTLSFNNEQGLWTIDKDIKFCHDLDCQADDRQKIIDRFSQRIENLRYILKEETKPALFICFYSPDLAPQDITETHRLYNNLYQSIAKYRKERKFKFLVVDTFNVIETKQLLPEIEVFSCKGLPSSYAWHIEECHCRSYGLKFEQQYIAKVMDLTNELCAHHNKNADSLSDVI